MLCGLSEHGFPVFPRALQLLCEDKLEGEARRWWPFEYCKLLVSHASSSYLLNRQAAK